MNRQFIAGPKASRRCNVTALSGLILGVAFLGVGTVARAGVIADLSGNWSDSINVNTSSPNGTWAYREGTTVLPSVSPWTAGGTSLTGDNQPAWAPSNDVGNFLPAELRANVAAASEFAADPNNPGHNNVLPGNVIMHTNDQFNGDPSKGVGNYLFTSNVTVLGLAEISGMVWDAGLLSSRPQSWNLLLNGVSIASGNLNGTVSRSQAQTFDLLEPLVAGESVELDLSRASAAGNFTGASLTIQGTLPEPAALGLLAPLSLMLLRRRRNA